MTKGRFALLTSSLGLATMAGAVYVGYASASSAGSHGQAGGASGSHSTVGSGGVISKPTDGTSGGAGLPTAIASSDQRSTTSSPKAPMCVNDDIQVSVADGQGAAGHESIVLVFQNVSSHICYLRGYPGASAEDQAGRDLLDAQRTLTGYIGGATGLSAPPRVVLQAGDSASAVLEWDAGPTATGACDVPSAASLAATPPNTTKTTVLTWPNPPQICQSFEIHPVVPGVSTVPANS